MEFDGLFNNVLKQGLQAKHETQTFEMPIAEWILL